MLGNYRVAAQLVASRVVLSSIELASYYYVYIHGRRHEGQARNPHLLLDFGEKIKLEERNIG
jgi:hypothetical protein